VSAIGDPTTAATLLAAAIAGLSTIVVAAIGLFGAKRAIRAEKPDSVSERTALLRRISSLERQIDRLQREKDGVEGKCGIYREQLVRAGINPDTGRPFDG
jgi:hypothetical protein